MITGINFLTSCADAPLQYTGSQLPGSPVPSTNETMNENNLSDSVSSGDETAVTVSEETQAVLHLSETEKTPALIYPSGTGMRSVVPSFMTINDDCIAEVRYSIVFPNMWDTAESGEVYWGDGNSYHGLKRLVLGGASDGRLPEGKYPAFDVAERFSERMDFNNLIAYPFNLYDETNNVSVSIAFFGDDTDEALKAAEELAGFGMTELKVFRMPAEVFDFGNSGGSAVINPSRESNINRADALDLTYYYNDEGHAARDNTVESAVQSAVRGVEVRERYVYVYYYKEGIIFGDIKPLPADINGRMNLPEGYSASVTVNGEPIGIDCYAYETYDMYVIRFTFDNPLEDTKSLWESGIEIRVTIKSDTIRDD